MQSWYAFAEFISRDNLNSDTVYFSKTISQ